MNGFTHLDEDGRVRMVDVTDKSATHRTAVAQCLIRMNPDTFERIRTHKVMKGNVLETARIAGVMAAKRTSTLIPMCHPLNITHVQIDFQPHPESHAFAVRAEVRLLGPTGVEMEALTAVAVAALTIYDMCKSHDRRMIITDMMLLEKSGGKSGHYIRE
jgi:cyclic pyranopterin monophosphate synthase